MRRLIPAARTLSCALIAIASLSASSSARAEKVRVAVIDPFSGSMAVLSQTVIRSFQASEEVLEQSKQGSGNQIEFVAFDNKLSATESLSQLKLAIDQGFRYVTQGVGSGSSAALIDAIEKYNQRNPGREVVYINWGSNDPDLTNSKCSFWHFRMDANSDMKIEALTDYMAKSQSVKKVYLMNVNWPQGIAVSRLAKEYFKRKRPDLQIVGDDLVPLAQVKDFAPYIAKIKSSGADSVITSNGGPDLALLLKAAKEANLAVSFYTFFANGGGIPTAIGAKDDERVKLISYFTPNIENFSSEAVTTLLKKKYKDDFTPLATHSGLVMLHQAFKETKTTDPVKVAYAMEGMKFTSFAGEIEMRKSDHQAQQALYVSTWAKVDGKKVRFDQEDTGYGWRTDAKIAAYVATQPTSCEMKRPPRP